jgi:hypothetical protein
MPDQPSTPGSRAIARARGWLGDVGSAARNYGGRAVSGIRNAIPGTQNHDWRQTVDAATQGVLPLDFFNSQERRWNTPLEWFGLGGNRAGAPLPDWLQPGAASTQPEGWAAPTLPGTLPQGQGPLMSHQNQPSRFAPGRASPSSGAGRMGGQTIAEGDAAVSMARGFAGTGLGGGASGGGGASSVGRDQLMRRNREA